MLSSPRPLSDINFDPQTPMTRPPMRASDVVRNGETSPHGVPHPSEGHLINVCGAMWTYLGARYADLAGFRV